MCIAIADLLLHLRYVTALAQVHIGDKADAVVGRVGVGWASEEWTRGVSRGHPTRTPALRPLLSREAPGHIGGCRDCHRITEKEHDLVRVDHRVAEIRPKDSITAHGLRRQGCGEVNSVGIYLEVFPSKLDARLGASGDDA